MHNYGYNDFDSIKLINDYYDLYFKIFNYTKIKINSFVTKEIDLVVK